MATENLQGENLSEFKVYISCKDSPLPKEKVSVVLDREKFNARELDGRAKELSDANWQRRLDNNPKLFNALKFRLAGFEELDPTKNNARCLRLDMGITDYKTFLCTNRASEEEMVASLPDPVEPYLADVLGISALIYTSDGMVPLHRRSMKLGEFGGWWDIPGGHPEPSSANIDRDGANDADESQRALDELFSSIADEVRAEVNIPEDKMLPPRLMGVVRAKASRWRPSAVFLIPVKMTGKEVAEAFRAGAEDAYESTSFALFDATTLVEGKGSVRYLEFPPETETGDGDSILKYEDIESILVPSAGLGIHLLREYKLHDVAEELLRQGSGGRCCTT